MSDSRRNLSIYLLFTLLVVLATFVGSFFYFNRGGYQPPVQANIPFEEITRTTSTSPPRTFVDTPLPRVQRGRLMLVDAAHRNAFNQAELVTLMSRVAERGHGVEFLGSYTSIPDSERLSLLEQGLGRADSLVVILPRDPYTRSEVAVIQRFLDKGGRLLLIADPTRINDINSLAQPLGLEFQADYLFNQVEYDLNFQHIFVRDFQPGYLTQGLSEIALYTAGSIKSSGGWLAATDENTQSTFAPRTEEGFHPIARGNHRNVLAIYDLTFLVPPHHSMVDNDRLVANIADFLTDGQRGYELADFPGFFRGEVDILLGQPTQFNVGSEVKALLAQSQINAQIREMEDTTRDTVFLGLYQDSSRAAPYLEGSGVQVSSALNVPSLANIPASGTSIVVLNRSQDRHVLVVLGNTESALADAVRKLETGAFRAGLVDQFVGVYKTE
jgi:hypothetical protein